MAASPIICFLRAADSNNTPLSGAKANIYQAGTTTPLSLFSDTGLSVGAANPIVADAYGQFPIRYFSPVAYKISTTTSADVAVTGLSWDNLDPGVPITTGALPVASGGTGSTTAGGARTNLGAASDATVTSIASDVTTLQGYHTGTTALKVASGTTAQRSGSPANYDIRGNSTLSTPEIYLGGTWHKISLSPSVLSFQNLAASTAASSTSVTITADSVTVRSTNKVAITLNSVSLTIDCTTTGANGLDAGALANTTFYYGHVIFNPTTGTTAGLVSSSATAPTLPSGYTFSGMFTVHRTDSSAQFLGAKQYGRRLQYLILREMDSGGAKGSVTVPTFVSVAVGSFVPTTVAFRIFGSLWVNNGTGMVAPNASYGAHTSGPLSSQVVINMSAASTATPFDYLLESTNLHWATNASGAFLRCSGFEINI